MKAPLSPLPEALISPGEMYVWGELEGERDRAPGRMALQGMKEQTSRV